jgi:hypothetical protein
MLRLTAVLTAKMRARRSRRAALVKKAAGS